MVIAAEWIQAVCTKLLSMLWRPFGSTKQPSIMRLFAIATTARKFHDWAMGEHSEGGKETFEIMNAGARVVRGKKVLPGQKGSSKAIKQIKAGLDDYKKFGTRRVCSAEEVRSKYPVLNRISGKIRNSANPICSPTPVTRK